MEPLPVPLASRDPLLWACTREGAFVLLGDRFHLLAGTQGVPILGAAAHLGRIFLATPQGLLQLVGSETRRARRGLVTCLLADGWGDLWVGTEREGLLRSSGEGWKSYRGGRQLPDDHVRGAAEDGDGLLYVGTGVGVTCLDRPRWLTITREWSVRGVQASPTTGRVWVAHQTGAAAFRGLHRVERLDEDDLPGPVDSILDSGDGWTWFAAGSKGLWRWRPGEEIRRVPLNGERPDEPARAAVTHLLGDPDGTVWALMRGQGVARLHGPQPLRLLGLSEGLLSPRLEVLARCPTPL